MALAAPVISTELADEDLHDEGLPPVVFPAPPVTAGMKRWLPIGSIYVSGATAGFVAS